MLPLHIISTLETKNWDFISSRLLQKNFIHCLYYKEHIYQLY